MARRRGELSASGAGFRIGRLLCSVRKSQFILFRSFYPLALLSLKLVLRDLHNVLPAWLVKNFTNSLDCDAAAYLNRDPFSSQPYGSPLSSPFTHELIYPTHGEYFSKVEQLAPN